MVFEDARELNRQGRYDAPDRATGANKAWLAALGYKATGESNKWGDFMNMMPGVTSVGRNMIAGGIAGKGSDVNKVIKGQRDEAFADTMAGLKFGIEGAKLAGTIMTGGAGSSAMSGIGNFGSGIMKGMGGDWGGAAMSTVAGLNDVATMQRTKDALNKDLEGLNTDDILNKANQKLDENGNPIEEIDDNANPIEGLIKKDDDPSKYVGMTPEQIEAAKAEEALNDGGSGSGLENTLSGISKVSGALPVIGDFAGAFANTFVTGAGVNKAGIEEYGKLRQSKVRQSAFSYL